MEIRHANAGTLASKRKAEHDGYEYIKRDFLPKGCAGRSVVSIYEIPPMKSAYPYHYHLRNEETFYIISGRGVLKTPDGERAVTAGDLLFFPADAGGAHKLTNSSATEALVYLDFDAVDELDAAVYPDSGKIGVWGRDANWVFRREDAVDYYDGE